MGFTIITLDGPAGVGKSTLASLVAKKLNFVYIDTGALFRSMAWEWNNIGCPENENKIKIMAENLEIFLKKDKVFCNQTDITMEIRKEEISILASKISSFSVIRDILKQKQRLMVSDFRLSKKINGVILEGRDTGSVVFPNANFKFFIDADVYTRSKRRFEQMKFKGEKVNYRDIYLAIKERDSKDISREIAPLKPTKDSIIIDTSKLNTNQVIDKILKKVK